MKTEIEFGLRWQSAAATPLSGARKSIFIRALPGALQNMTVLLLCLLALIPSAGRAATNDLTALLQQGLFEEQASRNLDAAIADYQTLASQFDKDRQLAATAVFRLGECYRAQGKINEAAVQYQRILRDFSDQTILVTLSRQDLTGMGMGKTDVATPQPAMENADAQLLKKLEGRSQDDLEKLLPTLMPSTTLDALIQERDLARTQRAKLLVDYAPDNVQVVRLDTQIKAYDQQILDTTSGIMQALKLRAELPPSQLATRPAGLSAPASSEEDQEIARIQQMIQNSPDLINARGEDGRTLLTQAASKGWLKVVSFLLDHGVDVNSPDSWALNAAASTGNRAMIELLLSRGADVNRDDALLRAVQKKYLSVVDVLIRNKADVNRQNDKGRTALSFAVENGDVKIVQLLLAAGADPNLKDDNDQSPVSFATLQRSPEIVKILLAAKADPDGGTLDAPLLASIGAGDVASTELLLQAGADPNAKGRYDLRYPASSQSRYASGWSAPLPLAVSSRQLPVVRLLIKFKADVNYYDRQVQLRPLLFGALADTNILEALLAAGSKPDARNDSETINNLPRHQTALHVATDGNPDAVRILLQHGADPNARDAIGWTPLHYAAHRLAGSKSLDVFELLLADKADPNARDVYGQTPLSLVKTYLNPAAGQSDAAEKSKLAASLADLLRQHGALDDLPDFSRIRITRVGLPAPLEVFHDSQKLTNHFTVLETLTTFYGIQQIAFAGQGNRAAWDGLPFPDFGRIIIRRPAATIGLKEQEIKVSLLNNSNVIDCALDVPVKFGDVIEIPESNHALNAEKPNPVHALDLAAGAAGSTATFRARLSMLQQGGPSETYQTAARCLQKSVQLVVAGQPTALLVNSWSEGFLKQALDKTEAKSVLRSSSDLSHVQVTRKNNSPAGSEIFTVDVTSDSGADDLWLQAGDVIEVPEKP